MTYRILFYFWGIIFLSVVEAGAQEGPIGSEAGMRFGVRPAFSYRFVPKEKRLFELIFTKSGSSLLFTSLYQKQQPIGPLGLYQRYGAGFSLGGWNGRLLSGLDAQAGIDYYLPMLPVVVSLDLRPWMRITGDFSVSGELAASLRYVF